jgi:nucleoside 2-deoxyribosyltransferase
VNRAVYLAGPISGLTFDGASEWRDRARDELRTYGIEALSPLRSKEYLRALGELSPKCGREGKAGVLSLPRGIMRRDSFDVHRVSVVLVNLIGADRVSIGTAMEMAWAWRAHIPVVVAMEDTNVHRHAMLDQATDYRVETIEEAIAVTISVIGGGK